MRFTFARILANFFVLPSVKYYDYRYDHLRSLSSYEMGARSVDAVARPLMTGLGLYGFFLAKMKRFGKKLTIHGLGSGIIFAIALYVVTEQSFLMKPQLAGKPRDLWFAASLCYASLERRGKQRQHGIQDVWGIWRYFFSVGFSAAVFLFLLVWGFLVTFLGFHVFFYKHL